MSMFCPQCGQERISEATKFCSRCGYLLTGTADLMRTGGVIPNEKKTKGLSPRSRGIRQGLFMFLLTFVIAPIIGMISVFAFRIPPWPMGIVVFMLGVGGLLRMAYALLFEPEFATEDEMTNARELPPSIPTASLPPQRDMPASVYTSPAGGWREPETQTPGSVTESTTRLLERDPDE